MEFPISVKCYDVLNIPGKRVDVIHTFDTEGEYKHWLRLVKQWDSIHEENKRSSKREILQTVQPPTMIVTEYVKGA